jgi:autotransporter-associated beta strand protein
MKKSIFCMGFMAFFAAQGAGTLTFAPGDGQTTNVTEMIGGTFDALQINSGTSGGGIVNLLNPLSYFSGAPTVDCGTLAVSDLRPIGQPSALGRGTPGDVVTLKNGTFRYAGAPGETDRGIVFSPTATKGASIIDVVDGTSLRMTGRTEVEKGVIIKRGGGEFVMAYDAVGVSNQLARYDFVKESVVDFPANGDSPSAATPGYGNFTVFDGTFTIDTPNTSTNWFCLDNAGYGYIGLKSTTTGQETEAHLVVRGGVNMMPRNFFVGHAAGDTTTAAQTLHHSLDVYGGVFDNSASGSSIYLGASAGKDINKSVSHLNIYGGDVRTFYFRPGQSLGNVSRTFISGGRLSCYGVYGGQYDGPKTWDDPDAAYVPDIDIHVCSNGTLRLTSSTFYLARDSLVNQTVRLTDGGLLHFSGFCGPATASVAPAMRTTFIVDGGRLRTNERGGEIVSRVTTKIGEKGLSWQNTYTYTVNGPVTSLDGVAADGGMELYGSGVFKFFGPTSFNGPVVVKDTCALTVSNLFSASSVTMTDGALSTAKTGATVKHLKHASGTGRFDFGLYADVVPKLTLLAWDAPALVSIKLGNMPPVGSYELIDFPASVGLTAARVGLDGTFSAGTDCTFSITTSGDVSTLVLTVSNPGSVVGTAYSWEAAAGGDWSAGGNWSGGSAPAANTLADVTFTATPSADPVTVTLDSAAKVSSLAFPATGGYRVAGSGSIALDKNNAKVTVTASGAATNYVDVPVVAAGPVEFDIPKKGRVEFASISGVADLTMNCSTRGGGNGWGGTVTIGSIDGLQGKLDFLSGLISVGTIPNSIRKMRVGYGEFRYTGATDATLACPVELASDDYAMARIGVVDPDATLTLSGPVVHAHGGFLKTGQGVLTFAGPYDYALGLNYAGYGDPPKNRPMGWDNVKDQWIWDSNGRVPTYSSCWVAGGKLVWGGTPGQTMSVGSYGLIIGSISTSEPGKEYDAELDILGGETTVNGTVTVSQNHGNSDYSTASKPRLSATLNVSGGTLTAKNLYLALEDRAVSTADAYYVQTGGDVNVSTKTVIGYKGANCTSSFTLSGGTFRSADLSVGESKPAPNATIVLSGGLLDVPGSMYMREGTNTLSVLEGATLRTSVCAGEKAGQDNTLHFDGGTLVARLTQTGGSGSMQRFKVSTLGAKGMIVDATDVTNKMFVLNQSFTTASGVVMDGGITVTGAVRNVGVVAFSGESPQYFNGGVTVGRNGNVRTYGDALTNVAVRVKDGGIFGPQWTSTSSPACVASLVMGETAGDRTTFLVQTALPNYGSNIYPGKIFARDSFTLNGTVDVAFANDGQDALVAPSGTHTILIAPKNSIDVSKFTITAEGPELVGTFAVSSYNADYDMLTVTLTAPAPVDHVWTAAGSGSWLTPGNWSAAPTDSGTDTIVFPSTLAVDADVVMGGDRTVGAIAQNSEAAVSLTGGTLEFANSAPSVSTVSNGVLELPAVSSSAAVTVNPSASSGKVVLSEAQGDASFAIKGGTLESTIANIGNGAITANNGTLSLTGDGVVDVPVTATGNGMILRTDGDTFFTDDVSVKGTFVKSGPGTAYLCGSGSVTLGDTIRDTPSIGNAATALTELPSNGDLPANSLPGAFTLSAGKIVTGINSSQYVTIGKHFYFGSSLFELDGNGDIVPSELEIYGGTFNCGADMYMARNAGVYGRNYPALRNKRRNLTFTLWDGTFSCNGLYTQHKGGTDYYRGNVTINIHNGSFTSRGSYVCIGYDFNAANTNIFNIYGGKMEFTASTWSVSGRPLNGNFDLNLYGGEFSTKLPFFSNGNTGQTVNYNLAGGTLTLPLIYHKSTADSENLLWDGGVYKPTSNDCALVGTHKTWTKNECRAGGAKFDLSGISDANAKFTCDQAFTHQASLEGEDGGVEMLGGGTLVLSVANTMNGPVKVSGGVVKATAVGAVPALVLGAGGAFDGNGLDHAVTYLKGSGGTAGNGSVSVADSMAPLADVATDAPYAVVANLAFGEGCLVACPVEEDEGVLSAPYFRVTQSCAGTARLDFGRGADDPLPSSFRVKVAECAAGVVPPAVRGVNTGVEKRYFVASENVANASTGMTDVYAVFKPVGTMMLFK